MAKKQKRPDLFTPELEQFHQEAAGNLSRVTAENALETARAHSDAFTKTDQGLGKRNQKENNNR